MPVSGFGLFTVGIELNHKYKATSFRGLAVSFVAY